MSAPVKRPTSINFCVSSAGTPDGDVLMPNEKDKGRSVLTPWWSLLKYSAVGVVFGIVLVKGEVVSWFRIQEMFRLQSFHMYGVIGMAVIVAMVSVLIIKRLRIKTVDGEPITFQKKTFNKGQIIGGLIFGFGWAMTGACPGPLFAQIAMGFGVVAVVLLSALAGTWVYGYFREKLPH
jgi:hypothetical protein